MFFTMGVIRRPLVATGHETHGVNAAVMRRIASAVRTRLLRRAVTVRAAMTVMPVVALVSARLFRLRFVAAAVVALTMPLLSMTAPAIA